MPANDPPRYADAAEVAAQAQEWPDEFLECRTDGHVWRPARATWNAALRYFYAVRRCSRCGTEAHAELTERGHVTAKWYVYADGYLTKRIGRIVGDGRDALRLASLQRLYGLKTTRRMSAVPHSAATRRELGMTG